MKQSLKRVLACATGLTAALAVLGAIESPSQAQPEDRAAARLARIAASDPTATIDSTGKLFFREPIPERRGAPRETARKAPPFPLDRTFSLHSKPGSRHTILLDFDGMYLSGSLWNSQDGLAAGNHPAWNPEGSAATFSSAERTAIQEIWQQVAEDYAPFDVDVTTEDLGGIVNGTRALISPSSSAFQNPDICGGECGGVAYLDVFGDDFYQPAWIFPQALYDDPKAIGEAVSHEVGHTLSLEHDGKGQEGYYEGHAFWAPIMGLGYYRPVTQWSRGDYAGATAHQDDLGEIADRLGLRTDEAGDSVAQAAGGLPAGAAYITSGSDLDFYELGECTGSVRIEADSAPLSPNLDIELRLYEADGTQVASADPLSARVDDMVASGMSATISTSVPAGAYVVSVDGVGRGSATAFYDGYGSLGAYTLVVSGCDGSVGPDPDPDPVVPGVPVITSVAGGPRGGAVTATVGWIAPGDDGGSAITGYRVKATRWSGGRAVYTGYVDDLRADKTRVKINVRKAGSWSFRVQALNDIGRGPFSPASRRVRAR
jgi:hypothetical protein